jgi:hypothetical protein
VALVLGNALSAGLCGLSLVAFVHGLARLGIDVSREP